MENREIKFRAWDGVKMHYLEDEMFWLIGKSKYFELQDHRAEHFDTIESQNGYKDLAILNNCDNEQLVLMQYIGKEDKYGTSIYQGDIVKCFRVLNEEAADIHIGIVEWDELHCSYYFKSIKNEISRCVGGKEIIEIIGNIYQSPELLTPPKH